MLEKKMVDATGKQPPRNLAAASEIWKIPKSTLINALRYSATIDKMQEIAVKIGYPDLWDMLWAGRMLSSGHVLISREPKYTQIPSPPMLRAVPEGELESDYHQIPFRDDMRLAADEGEAPENFYELETSPVVIHKSDVKRHLSANLVAFRVGGRSMEPTIMKNGIIVVDVADRDWDNLKKLGVYMLRLDGVPAVKRLMWAKKKKILVVFSDNPAENTVYCDLEEDDVELFGRVIWIWGEH